MIRECYNTSKENDNNNDNNNNIHTLIRALESGPITPGRKGSQAGARTMRGRQRLIRGKWCEGGRGQGRRGRRGEREGRAKGKEKGEAKELEGKPTVEKDENETKRRERGRERIALSRKKEI